MTTVYRAASSTQGYDEAGRAAHKRDFPQRMVDGLRVAARPCLVVLSGRDFVAREFEQVLANDNDWKQFCNNCEVQLQRIDDADHTVSTASLRAQVEQLSTDWVTSLHAKNEI